MNKLFILCQDKNVVEKLKQYFELVQCIDNNYYFKNDEEILTSPLFASFDCNDKIIFTDSMIL